MEQEAGGGAGCGGRLRGSRPRPSLQLSCYCASKLTRPAAPLVGQVAVPAAAIGLG